MSKDLIIVILGLAFAGCAAALLVAIAKRQEEREKRWSEISRAVGLENELEQSKAREKCSAEALLWYADHLAGARVIHENLQDRLSALLCPTNNHIWKDGVCVKCGRVQDAEIH